jgi:hypothetical protein
MLNHDRAEFYSRFHEAASFLTAADVRLECYSLCRNQNRNQWAEGRVDDLLDAPACRVPWFVIMIRADCPWMEETLIKNGL